MWFKIWVNRQNIIFIFTVAWIQLGPVTPCTGTIFVKCSEHFMHEEYLKLCSMKIYSWKCWRGLHNEWQNISDKKAAIYIQVIYSSLGIILFALYSSIICLFIKNWDKTVGKYILQRTRTWLLEFCCRSEIYLNTSGYKEISLYKLMPSPLKILFQASDRVANGWLLYSPKVWDF